MDIFYLFLSGLGGGLIAGLLGIGGGIIYILIFSIYLKNFSSIEIESSDMVQLMISNSLFAIFFAGLSGSYKQWKSHNFYIRPVLLIGISGVFTSLLLKNLMLRYYTYSTHDFAIVFSLLMIPLLIRMFFQSRHDGNFNPEHMKAWKLIITGLITGFASSLSGLGGGFIMIPVLNGLFKIPMKKTISISLGAITVISFGYSIFNLFFTDYPQYQFYLAQGSIVFSMVLPVIAGVLLGTPIGVKLSHRLPPLALKALFAIFTLLVISKLLINFL